MTWRVELARDAQKQLLKFPRDVRRRLEHAINDFEEKDESAWSNVKALQGDKWKGYFRRRVGDYRIIFEKIPDRGVVEISAVLIKTKDTYR